MTKKRYIQISAFCLVLISILSMARPAQGAQDDDKNAPGTLIKSARFLEVKPFDKEAKKVRSWAVNWVIATDKVTVTICTALLTGIDDKYKYSSEILAQYTIGMAAFKLANPDQAADEDAAQQAGVDSALTSYEAMVQQQPKAKNAFMDMLIAKRADGSLAKWVLDNNCKEKK